MSGLIISFYAIGIKKSDILCEKISVLLDSELTLKNLHYLAKFEPADMYVFSLPPSAVTAVTCI